MTDKPASEQIDDIINNYETWKGGILTQIRSVVMAADADIVEEVKWKMPSRPLGLPVWSHSGKMVCFAEIWKDNVKLLFAKGAHLQDSNKLFNARLESTDIRAIEYREGDKVDRSDLTVLVHEAVKLNQSRV